VTAIFITTTYLSQRRRTLRRPEACYSHRRPGLNTTYMAAVAVAVRLLV